MEVFMSEAAVLKKLDIVATIKDGIAIGMKNIGPILVNVLLYVLTAWIPYLNIGTTIALSVGIVAKASRGESISFTEIFDPKYRRYMGEFFLTSGLVGMGIGVGMILFFIPGIVIGIAWSLSLLLVIDKGKNPTEAITMSNDRTYGNKARIFGIYAILSIAFSIAAGILSAIGGIHAVIAIIMALIILAAAIVLGFVYIGVYASIYKQLTEDLSEDTAEAI
jgi:putative flippase GtrA